MPTFEEVIMTAQEMGYYPDLLGLASFTGDLRVVVKFILTYASISGQRRVDPNAPLSVE